MSNRIPFFLAVMLWALVWPGRVCATTWAKSGLVVSDCELASAVGRDVIRSGGNAIDGAVATAFALTVTFPWSAPIGGGGFAVIHLAGGEDLTLDFRECAPARAHRDMYLDEDGEILPGRSLITSLAVGVPGTVDGLLQLLNDHGSGAVSLAEILGPAIALARNGFPVGAGLAAQLESKREYLSRDPSTRALFVKDSAWCPGDILAQADLARSLQEIAEHGRGGFYGGEIANRMVTKMQLEGGLVDLQDLRDYEAIYRDPVRGVFQELEVLSMGPPSSGGVLVLQMLKMFELAPPNQWEWNSAEYIHWLTESQRRSFADRSVHLGDPEFWDVPLANLLEPDYVASRVSTVALETSSHSIDVSCGAFTAAKEESNETTHLSVVDGDGNAVSMTLTLNAGFGSGLTLAGTGILLNNQMDDFSARPGTPNLYGLVGNEANAIASRKRMLSSMSPTIVLDSGEPKMILGSPGGSRIINAVLQVVLNHMHFGMSLRDAVAAPRTHSQWLPDRLFYERRALAPGTRSRLESMGHQPEECSSVGRVNAIAWQNGVWLAVSDPRGDGGAAGY